MADEPVGPSAPIVSVRPGRNRLAEEDRALQAAKRERKQKKKQGSYGGYDQNGGAMSGGGHAPIDDDVTILGIPKDEMTDNVRHAIDTLLDEIQHLRAELVRAKGHEAYLEEQAEKDRMLHVMRRRAFMARLGLAVRRTEEEAVHFSFVYVQVTNAQAVRTGYGHGALESLMQHAADTLREGAEPGDVIGSLENSDFGMILPGTTLEQAEAKASRILSLLSGRTFVWQGESVAIEAAFGDCLLAPGDSGEDVIARAKANMMARQDTSAV